MFLLKLHIRLYWFDMVVINFWFRLYRKIHIFIIIILFFLHSHNGISFFSLFNVLIEYIRQYSRINCLQRIQNVTQTKFIELRIFFSVLLSSVRYILHLHVGIIIIYGSFLRQFTQFIGCLCCYFEKKCFIWIVKMETAITLLHAN